MVPSLAGNQTIFNIVTVFLLYALVRVSVLEVDNVNASCRCFQFNKRAIPIPPLNVCVQMRL